MLRLFLILFLLFQSIAFALVAEVREDDGSPVTYPWQLKFPAGSLTDNGDATTSVSFAGAGGDSISVDSVAVVDPDFQDTAEINVTDTSNVVTFDIVAGSIDETKLDASTNASLDLADSALQAEVDGSTTNEINTIQGDDDVATTGLAISIDGAGTVTTDVVGDTLTITGSAHTVDTTLNLAGAETITGNWVNTANPWASNEITEADPTVDTEAEIEAILGIGFGAKTATSGNLLQADGVDFESVAPSTIALSTFQDDLTHTTDTTCSDSACTIGTDDTVTLEQGTAPSQTAEGRIQWDTDDDYLKIGDGASFQTFVPTGTLTDTKSCTWDGTAKEIDCDTTSGAGDITDVYNCASGDCNSIVLADGDLLNMGSVSVTSETEGLILPFHATDCSGSTADGQICWERDADTLYIGDGALGVVQIGVSTLSGLTDTTITTPTDNEHLVYSSGSWVNTTPLWQDNIGGSPVYLGTTGHAVVIGDGSSGDDGKLFVKGDADEVQFHIELNGTQTTDAISIHDSGQTNEIFEVQADGDVTIKKDDGTIFMPDAQAMETSWLFGPNTDGDMTDDDPFEFSTGATKGSNIKVSVSTGGIVSVLGGIDAIGAVDLDYGSADVTDHTFISDNGTNVILDGTASAIGVNEIVDKGDTASDSVSGIVELATIAETDTGTDATRAITPDGLQGSDRNIRYMVFTLVADDTDVATATSIGGDFVIPVDATIIQSDSLPHRFACTNSTAGTTGTQVVDLHYNGTTVMTTNKIDTDTAEKTSATGATLPDLTTTDVAAGGIFTWDVDAVHTTAAKGLRCTVALRED